MRRRTKSEVERFLTRELLEGMGYRVLRLQSPRPPCPDVFVTIEKGGHKKKVGIELTDYYVDEVEEGGSAVAALDRFWQELQTSIRCRMAQRRNLWHVAGHVFFRATTVPRGRPARQMAAELVGLALESCVPLKGKVVVRSFSASSFPVLHTHISEVILHGNDFGFPLAWTRASASHVGVLPQQIIGSIAKKSGKTYDWRDATERWLLICAHGDHSTSSLGPRPEAVAWDKDGMTTAANESPFDRVLVWERVCDWCKPLKPAGPALHLRQER